MNAAVDQAPCTALTSSPCPFPQLPRFPYRGRNFCLAHLPLTAPDRAQADLHAFIQTPLAAGHVDFCGIVLSNVGGVYELNRAGLNFKSAVFGDGIHLRVAGDADFSESQFCGGSIIEPSSVSLCLRGARFFGKTVIRGEGLRPIVDLTKARFENEARFVRLELRAPFRADEALFSAPLIFNDCTLPQQSSFYGVRFRRGDALPGAEGDYRTIRNLFEKHRNREVEGLFYALEKRSHRRSLTWHSPPRWMSAIYDWIAGYGQSFERAALSFLLLQCVFGLTYAAMAGRLQIPGFLDIQIVAFTLSQVVKPFELLSGRTPDGVMADILGEGGPTGGWLLLTFAHGVTSLVVLALFVLALRWRFKRE